MIRFLLGVLRFILLLVAVAAFILLVGDPLVRGYLLRQRIVSALEGKVSVRLIEHSDRHDASRDRAKPHEEKIYRTVTLTPKQVLGLPKTFPVSLDYSFVKKQAGIFSPHHRLEISNKAGTVTTLELGFRSRELSLDDSDQRIFPLRWDESLRQLVSSLGLNPDLKDAN